MWRLIGAEPGVIGVYPGGQAILDPIEAVLMLVKDKMLSNRDMATSDLDHTLCEI